MNNNNNNDNNDNRIELIGLIQDDEDDIELGDADFERPFPDSDEAIRALQDIAESVDEMEAECHRLRAELKTALAERDAAREERDDARREICEYQPGYYGTNSVTVEAHHAAERRGWDCFKETP